MVNHLRERRQHVKLTQQALANLAGCSRSMVRLFEAGYVPTRRSPTLRHIERVLDELDGAGANGARVAPDRTRNP